MASVTDTVNISSSRMAAWVEAQSILMATDVTEQFIRAETEAARDLGYNPGDEWENDPKVFQLALTRF